LSRLTKKPADLLITGGMVLPLPQNSALLSPGALAVQAGRIAAVGDPEAIIGEYEAERTIDAVRDALTTADLDSDLARLTAASAFVNAYLASREQEGSVNAEVSSNHHLTSNQSKPNSPST